MTACCKPELSFELPFKSDLLSFCYPKKKERKERDISGWRAALRTSTVTFPEPSFYCFTERIKVVSLQTWEERHPRRVEARNAKKNGSQYEQSSYLRTACPANVNEEMEYVSIK